MKSSSKSAKAKDGTIVYTKTDIKDLFNSLDQRKKGSLPAVRNLVFSMNSHTKTPQGAIGLPDHLIFTPEGLIIVEVKMKSTKDRMSEAQMTIQLFLKTHNYTYYVVETYEQAAALRNAIYRANVEGVSHTQYLPTEEPVDRD